MSRRQKAYLRVLTGASKGGVYVLSGLAVFEIGRGQGCQVRLDDERCSMQHARIYRNEESWTFFDLNSENGSAVNDIPTVKRQLKGGEILRVGKTELQFTFVPPARKGSRRHSPSEESAGTGSGGHPPRRMEDSSFILQEITVSEDPGGAEGRHRLLVVEGDPRDLGRELVLDGRTTVTIGRAPGSDFVLSDRKVSRSHCTIERKGNHYILTDLGSSNGTVIHGASVGSTVLKVGDQFRLGFSVLSYELIPAAAKPIR
ncbi:MAG: FHA domain-containing protein [Planctomycetota bacterium]